MADDTPLSTAEQTRGDEVPVTVTHYVSGIVGAALLRSWYRSGNVNQLRMAELQAALDGSDDFPYNLALSPNERSVADGYGEWAEGYDGANPMIEVEEGLVVPWLETAVEDARSSAASESTVRALDAGCGTGRHAVRLEALGCEVTAVDATAEMLDVARTKLSPTADVRVGDLADLPLEANSIDVAVSSLAICHLPSPEPAIAELARVVRPGGTIIISEPHPVSGDFGGQAFFGGFENGMKYVRNNYPSMSDWIAAFIAHGVQIEACAELPYDETVHAANPIGAIIPDALRAALDGIPFILAWRLRVG